MQSHYRQRPRMTREDRERRKIRSRKVEAQIEFLDEPFRETVQATCRFCSQRLGWWEKEDDGKWRTQPLLPLPGEGFAPGEHFLYSYHGYADTGYEVHEIHSDHGTDGRGPRRISSTGGSFSSRGQRIGRRPRTNDAYVNRPGFGIPQLTVGQIVELPAEVYCPACEKATLNTIPVPVSDEKAV